MDATKTSLFAVNGSPLPAPDEDAEASYEDIDAYDAGRTLDGVMHRDVIRTSVAKFQFTYSVITDNDYNYIEGLFSGNPQFTFTYTDPSGTKSITAYRSKHSLTLHDVKRHLWRNYKFNIIEC